MVLPQNTKQRGEMWDTDYLFDTIVATMKWIAAMSMSSKWAGGVKIKIEQHDRDISMSHTHTKINTQGNFFL